MPRSSPLLFLLLCSLPLAAQGKPDPDPGEERLRGEVHGRVTAAFARDGRGHFPEQASAVQHRRTLRLVHPCLQALPRHRFYLAQFEVLFDDPRTKVQRNYYYHLVHYDRQTKALHIQYGLGRADPLEGLLRAGTLRAADNRSASRLHHARALLSQASMGAHVFLPKDREGLSPTELDQRFGLGKWQDRFRGGPHRVVETEDERVLMSWRLHADDFGMPLSLRITMHHFARKGGRHRRSREVDAGTLGRDARLDDPRVSSLLEAQIKKLQAGK